jgi:predicted hydrocarbon binding protein
VDSIITISGADKAGALARILSFFGQKGYHVKGQQISESPSGSRILKIRLDLAQVNRDQLAAELKSLNPDYNIVAVGFDGAEAGADKKPQTPDQSASTVIKQMAAKFPNIAGLVQAYGGSFGADAREPALFDAGRRIGAFHYAKEWSFGSPLKMPSALRRALVPALEKLAKVDASDTEVRLTDSHYCGSGKQVHCCEFLGGFMQGFLDAGPLTKNTKVQKVACSAKGRAHCGYTVAYTVE